MKNSKCKVLVIATLFDESKEIPVGTLCSNNVSKFFFWTKQHSKPDARKILAEYKKTKVLNFYFLNANCPIKEGDWMYIVDNEGKTYIEKCPVFLGIHYKEKYKIEATTDASLGTRGILQSFLIDYVGKDGNIKEVYIQMGKVKRKSIVSNDTIADVHSVEQAQSSGHKEYSSAYNKVKEDAYIERLHELERKNPDYYFVPVVDENRCVITSEVIEKFNRKQVLELLMEREKHSDYWSKEKRIPVKNWLEQNS